MLEGLTALNFDHRLSSIQKCLASNVTSYHTLKAQCGHFSSDSFYKPFRHDTTPPSLNLDGTRFHQAVPLDCKSPLHVLLNEGDELVETVGTKGFKGCKHACSEEDLGQARLIFVLLPDRLFENSGT